MIGTTFTTAKLLCYLRHQTRLINTTSSWRDRPPLQLYLKRLISTTTLESLSSILLLSSLPDTLTFTSSPTGSLAVEKHPPYHYQVFQFWVDLYLLDFLSFRFFRARSSSSNQFVRLSRANASYCAPYRIQRCHPTVMPLRMVQNNWLQCQRSILALLKRIALSQAML